MVDEPGRPAEPATVRVRPRPGSPPRRGGLIIEHADGSIDELDAVAGVDFLLRAPREGGHGSVRCWSDVTRFGLDMIGRRRLIPTLDDEDVDVWRIGPFDPADDDRVSALCRQAVTHGGPDLVREWLDTVADVFPRTAAAGDAVGYEAFAVRDVRPWPQLRSWVDANAAALRSGVRVSLRVDPPRSDDSVDVVVCVHGTRDTAVIGDAAVIEDAATTWSADSMFDPSVRVAVATILHRAAEVWHPARSLLAAAVPDRVTLDAAELADLVTRVAAGLAEIDVAVHLPAQLVTVSSSVTAHERRPAGRDVGAVLAGDAGVEFDWQLDLAGDRLTAAELNALAEAARPLVRMRDRWVVVTPEVARRARDRQIGPLAPIDALGAALTGTVRVDGHDVAVASPSWLDDLRDRLTDPQRAEEVEVPSGLAATLRDYQVAGLRWLAQLTDLGLGGCLADDMGLGKTITLIALHLHRAEAAARRGEPSGPTLVVCPASLLGTWEREIDRFAPGLTATRYHGDGRTLPDQPDGIVLTTYPTMRRDAGAVAARRWDLVVADEAQHVKNPASHTARALRTIPAGARVALTGTPIENTLSELWAILDWTTPGLLGSLAQFRSRWATPIEADADEAAAASLSRLTAPFVLRRRKSDPDIVPELPAKTETDQPVRLTPEQAGLYEAVVRETMSRIAEAAGMQRRGLVMAMLTSLKQVCNHPAHYLGEVDSALTGRSGKLALLDEIVDTVIAEDGAVLVFTQYVAMARLLERHLAERGVPVVFLHGGTPVEARQDLVDRFQSGAAPVFLASLRAAGTGLTLTRADHVVHYDRWWNPAVEDQATDRAYRIGQTRPVQVHRLLSIGTIEERIADILEGKRGLADAVMTAGETALSELSDDELADLVRLRGER